MSTPNDFNESIIKEFRENDGQVAGPFNGSPMILVHHVGRKSGTKHLSPMIYQPDDNDPSTMYVFASKAGAPTNPDWYYNLTAAGRAIVEVGTETFDVEVGEVEGDDRDRIYAEQVTRMPGFGEYAEKTKGVRTIPVLRLKRA